MIIHKTATFNNTQTFSEQIAAVLQSANQNKWPYPKRFSSLKKIGVITHTVSLVDGFKSTYVHSQGTWVEPTEENLAFAIASSFDEQALKTALIERAQEKTTYQEFLQAIAAAGVASYIANMKNDTVTYYSFSKDIYYIQAVPCWNE